MVGFNYEKTLEYSDCQGFSHQHSQNLFLQTSKFQAARRKVLNPKAFADRTTYLRVEAGTAPRRKIGERSVLRSKHKVHAVLYYVFSLCLSFTDAGAEAEDLIDEDIDEDLSLDEEAPRG